MYIFTYHKYTQYIMHVYIYCIDLYLYMFINWESHSWWWDDHGFH